ncbi:MAG TPA: hypothetical protein DEG88_15625 [Propionibacteriaceae bacterium]|nr:hypothetical protein [Propionibacteriaceae bacterium]HBY24639.1 hypothetical protein [Propionibacteriaceae bacterium]
METEMLARAQTPQGEVALRRRGDVVELIVNGVFAMDSAEVTSELVLADLVPATARRVLVGGLGLGFTADRLLARPELQLDVVELAGPLIEWARQGVTAQLGRVASDPRVQLHHADIAAFVEASDDHWDALLLDVDNGPTFLIHDQNAAVYGSDFLRHCLARLAPGGMLAIWCEDASPALAATLATLADVQTHEIPVTREGRDFTYVVYLATPR